MRSMETVTDWRYRTRRLGNNDRDRTFVCQSNSLPTGGPRDDLRRSISMIEES
jgi:hypothetical protein